LECKPIQIYIKPISQKLEKTLNTTFQSFLITPHQNNINGPTKKQYQYLSKRIKNMKRNYVVCCSMLLVFFVITLTTAFASNKESAKKIKTLSGKEITVAEMDEYLKAKMDSLGMPGMSIAIINDAKIVYHRALGVTNVDTKEKVTDGTLFDGGSLSKPPFAFLVMKMVEKGILNLDQPLYTYLPYPDIAYDKRYKLITARMVLCHTSGFVNWRFLNKDNKLELKFTPGTSFGYSGEGYEYLANVVAHLNNIPKNGLQDLFEKEVTVPLGMQHAYYTWNDYLEKHRASGHVDGKVFSTEWGTSAKNPNFFAAYSLQTEAISYANFLIAMIREEGLKKTTFDEMLKVHVVAPSKTDSTLWCLGIIKRHSEFGDEYLHDGNNYNFTCAFMFNQEQKFGYVFFTNCNKGIKFNKKLEPFLTGKDALRR
jgi:CubicO group peptidase (beta-lactamase class C family)